MDIGQGMTVPGLTTGVQDRSKDYQSALKKEIRNKWKRTVTG